MVREAVAAGADIIMLDNMELDAMREAVDYIAGRAIVEASGNMAKRDIREVARTGVDVISTARWTHFGRGARYLAQIYFSKLMLDKPARPGVKYIKNKVLRRSMTLRFC